MFVRFILLTVMIGATGLYGVQPVAAQDVKPKLLGNLKFTIPQEAIDLGVGGKIGVSVEIDKSGNAKGLKMAISPSWPCGREISAGVKSLTRSLEESLLKATYSPGMEGGKPIKQRLILWIDLQSPAANEFSNVLVVDEAAIRKSSTHLPAPRAFGNPNGDRDKGLVIVTISVDEKGQVVRTATLGDSDILQKNARETACQSTFSPYLVDGRPVKITSRISYMYN